jgi:hypothetical protein
MSCVTRRLNKQREKKLQEQIKENEPTMTLSKSMDLLNVHDEPTECTTSKKTPCSKKIVASVSSDSEVDLDPKITKLKKKLEQTQAKLASFEECEDLEVTYLNFSSSFTVN